MRPVLTRFFHSCPRFFDKGVRCRLFDRKMSMSSTPKWLRVLERYVGWIAVPQIAVILVTLQVIGFVFILQNPAWVAILALNPAAVMAGEYWRLITFLALPLSLSPLWLFFTLWFLYFVVN